MIYFYVISIIVPTELRLRSFDVLQLTVVLKVRESRTEDREGSWKHLCSVLTSDLAAVGADILNIVRAFSRPLHVLNSFKQVNGTTASKAEPPEFYIASDH